MQRILEPELMEDLAQAKAYSEADFETQHSKIIALIDQVFGAVEFSGEILDLGCGPGDVTFRLAHRFSKAKITGIDGSQAMVSLAKERHERELLVNNRVNFIQSMIPGIDIPRKTYDLIISTSFLHHLHQPDVLWQTIIDHSRPGTKVFVADLCRSESKSAARQTVNASAKNEPDVLKEDFYNSLLAAFT
ncbi:MAG: methyltransferase domain-containing protein, partial [Methyloprofundus sp.]|nr:methyltransferase domain-containing protein [Methyloprofundus sp.]